MTINCVCPLTMFIKCTNFDKHACEGFICLKDWNGHIYEHTHEQVAAISHSQQVAPGDINPSG